MRIISEFFFEGPHNNTLRIPHQRSEKGSLLTQQEYEEKVAASVRYINNYPEVDFSIDVASFPHERQLSLTPLLSLKNVQIV
jgi:hypothetical protein